MHNTHKQLPRHETAQAEADSEAAPLHAQNASEEFSYEKKDGAEPRHRPRDAGWRPHDWKWPGETKG